MNSYSIAERVVDNRDRISKMPLWCREYVQHLERHALRCEQELRRVIDYQTESPLSFSSNMLAIQDRIFIPSTTVQFKLSNDAEISFRLEDDHIHAMLTKSLNGKLSIRPCVSNVVDIYAL